MEPAAGAARPAAGDRLLHAAFQRAAKRFGIKPVAERAFKLSNDPRERDLGNVRLLTSDRDYDAVVVLDTQGEFAREVPYRTVLPRPVLGSNGLVAQAWSPFYERYGAPQLSRRFLRKAGRPMGSYDWATWMAARAAAEVAAAFNRPASRSSCRRCARARSRWTATRDTAWASAPGTGSCASRCCSPTATASPTWPR